MILHIPHSSIVIPAEYRGQFVLSDDELAAELMTLTDRHTQELFSLPGAIRVVFPLSRLVVDVERFPNDADEPMAARGMGMIYVRTASGSTLRRPLRAEECVVLEQAYRNHHDCLKNEVGRELAGNGRALIVDCHSFPDQPQPCDADQTVPRPDFCIGRDDYHTPEALALLVKRYLTSLGYRVEENRPFAGALVPLDYYQKDRRVSSVMIEVNRRIYMDEETGLPNPAFDAVKEQLTNLLNQIDYSSRRSN